MELIEVIHTIQSTSPFVSGNYKNERNSKITRDLYDLLPGALANCVTKDLNLRITQGSAYRYLNKKR